MSGKDVLIDAAVRFSVRRDMAQFDTNTDELQLVRQSVATQPGNFYRYISECSPNLQSMLKDEIESGMSTRVVEVVSNPASESEEEKTTNGTEGDSGVHYYYSESQKPSGDDKKQARKLKPRLEISTASIRGAHTLLDPLFIVKKPEAPANRNHLEASVITTTWMALGRWAFDKMDPRGLDEPLDENTTYRLLNGIAGLSRENCLGLDLENERDAIAETIDRAMLEVKYRFAGAMAYAGMVRQVQGLEVSEAPDQAEIKVFQMMMKQLLTARAKIMPNRITAAEFALSRPLSLKTAKKLIDFFVGDPKTN